MPKLTPQKEDRERTPDYGGFAVAAQGAPDRRASGDWMPVFLAMLRECGVIRYAAQAAGIDRRTAYDRKETDKEFAKAWQSAIDDSLDQIELRARQRAHDMSDTLAIFLLKSHRREIYGDKVDHNVTGDLGITIVHQQGVRAITDDSETVIEIQRSLPNNRLKENSEEPKC